MFAVLQNRRLNQHIIYTVVDEVSTSPMPDPPALTRIAGVRSFIPRINFVILILFLWLLIGHIIWTALHRHVSKPS
jgi:hypothetical protein